MTLDVVKNGQTKFPKTYNWEGMYTREELALAWDENLFLIESNPGNPYILFERGKLPFVFYVETDVSADNAVLHYNNYLKKNFDTLELDSKFENLEGIPAQINSLPVFITHIGDALKAKKIDQGRHSVLHDFFAKACLKFKGKSFKAMHNATLTLINAGDVHKYLEGGINNFDITINDKNLGDYLKITEEDLNEPKGKKILTDFFNYFAKLIVESTEGEEVDYSKLSKKLNFFFAVLFSISSANRDNFYLSKLSITRSLYDHLFKSLFHSISNGRYSDEEDKVSLRILKRAEANNMKDFCDDIFSIGDESVEMKNPFGLNPELIRSVRKAVMDFKKDPTNIEKYRAIYNLVLSEDIFLHIVSEKNKRRAETLLREKKNIKNLSPENKKKIAELEGQMALADEKTKSALENRDEYVKTLNTTEQYLLKIILHIKFFLKLFNEKTAEEEDIPIFMQLIESIPVGEDYLQHELFFQVLATKKQNRKKKLIELLKKSFKASYFDTEFTILASFCCESTEFENVLIESLEDKEILGKICSILKKDSGMAGAFALRILSDWCNVDVDKRLPLIMKNMLDAEEDYKDEDVTMRSKLFNLAVLLFEKDKDVVAKLIKTLLIQSPLIREALKNNPDADVYEIISKYKVFQAFDEKQMREACTNILGFSNPKNILSDLKNNGLEKGYDKYKALHEIKNQSSLGLVAPVFVDMTDVLPSSLRVKLVPKDQNGVFTWGVEIIYQKLEENRITREKIAGKFVNFQFRSGVTNENNDAFEKIAVLASHRYFVRDSIATVSDDVKESAGKLLENLGAGDSVQTVEGRTSNPLTVDIGDDKKDQQKLHIEKNNAKSKGLISAVLNNGQEAIKEEDVASILVFRQMALSKDEIIYQRVKVAELNDYFKHGLLCDLLTSDDLYVMVAAPHTQAAGYYLKEHEEGLVSVDQKKRTPYCDISYDNYIADGFNPLDMKDYKTKLAVSADALYDDQHVLAVTIEGEEDLIIENRNAVAKDLNAKIALKTRDERFIKDWTSGQRRVLEEEQRDPDEVNEILRNQEDSLRRNHIEKAVMIDGSFIVKARLFLAEDYPTQKVFNQGVFKRLKDVIKINKT